MKLHYVVCPSALSTDGWLAVAHTVSLILSTFRCYITYPVERDVGGGQKDCFPNKILDSSPQSCAYVPVADEQKRHRIRKLVGNELLGIFTSDSEIRKGKKRHCAHILRIIKRNDWSKVEKTGWSEMIYQNLMLY